MIGLAMMFAVGFGFGMCAPKAWAEACRLDRAAAMKGETSRRPR